MTAPEAATPAPRPSFFRRHWGWLTLAAVVGIPLLGLILWVAITLSYTYSTGERVGYVQKLSREGWMCKTWEGELALSNVPGQIPEKFHFTVRSDSIANAINSIAGNRVAITYEEHKGVPGSCFGDTPYFVTGVRAVK